MTVQNIISTAVASMTANSLSYSFFVGNESHLNVLADDVDLPVVFLSEPMKYVSQISNSGHYAMKPICMVLILFKDSFELTESQREDLFTKSRLAQRELHILLNNSQYVKNLTVETCVEIQYGNDAILSGVMMPFSFELKNTDSVCV